MNEHMHRYSIRVALVAGALSLAACGGGGGDEASVEPTASGLSANHSCTRADTFTEQLRFAGLREARHVLAHPDAWARQLSAFDMGIRQRKVEPTNLREFLAFASDAASPWTAEERAAWKPIIAKVSEAVADLHIRIPDVALVKTTGREEFGAAYTRGTAIMLPPAGVEFAVTEPRSAFFLLAHELFHVLSRNDLALRDNAYALLGFKQVRGVRYPAEFESGRLSNPDDFEYKHTVEVRLNSGATADVLPLLYVPGTLAQALQAPIVFDVLTIPLLAIDTTTGSAIRDGNGQPVTYDFGNSNWPKLLARNTSFILGAEEVLAENFASLMEWRSTGVVPTDNPAGDPINDVPLLESLQALLEGRCDRGHRHDG